MTEDGNSLKARIEAIGLKIGNEVLESSTDLTTTPSRQSWIDSAGRLAAGIQQPFALGATQSTITSPLFKLAGISQGGILTQTLVNGADVTTVTKAHFARVDVTDDNSVVVGSFYIELFTIL